MPDDDDFHDARSSSSSSSSSDDEEDPSCCGFVDAKTFSESFPLHRAAFDNDVPTLRRLLASMTAAQANAENNHGHTALHVAALRRAVGAVGALCERRDLVDVDRRDARGWDATRHATAQRARACLRALVKARMEASKTAFDSQKAGLMRALRGMTDFEMRAGWRFGSSVVGALVKMVAPRDSYDVTCAGDKLRVDGELRGLDHERMGRSFVPKWRRGRFSLIFDGSRGERAKLWFVDHASREVVNATERTTTTKTKTRGEDGEPMVMIPEEMSEEEMIEAQVDALLMEGPSKKRVRTEEFRFKPVKGWIAGNAKSWIKGRKTEVWEASAKMTREIITPGGGYKLDGTFEEYCASANEVRENETRVKPLGASSSVVDGDDDGKGRHKPAKKPKAKKVTARCWLVRDFPINAAQLSKILEIFTLVNKSAKRVGDVVEYWRDNHPDVFPVKIQVPLALSVYAQLHFKDFKALSAREREEKLESGFFDIPSDYRVKSMDELLDEAEERAYREMEFMESLENDGEDGNDDVFGEETEEMKKLRKQLERMAEKESRGDDDDEEEDSEALLPRLDEEDEDEEEDF
jgi:hypothetical protein